MTVNKTTRKDKQMKTAFNLKEGTRVFVSLDIDTAGALGQLLKWVIRESQKGETQADSLPVSLGKLLALDEALQVYSRCIEPGSPWLDRAEEALNAGDRCKDCGQDWRNHNKGMMGGIDCPPKVSGI